MCGWLESPKPLVVSIMNDPADWFGSWNDLIDTAVGAVLFYVLIVVMVRLAGKRSTSQLNNFDWIINITVGSLAASGILLDTVPALRAAIAIAIITILQMILTWGVRNFEPASRLVRARPTMLTHKGAFLENAMRETRISEDEIRSILREHGMTDKNEANWVILETDGRMTVIPRKDISLNRADAMQGVEVLDDLSEQNVQTRDPAEG